MIVQWVVPLTRAADVAENGGAEKMSRIQYGTEPGALTKTKSGSVQTYSSLTDTQLQFEGKNVGEGSLNKQEQVKDPTMRAVGLGWWYNTSQGK
jgi:hypothetical protein